MRVTGRKISIRGKSGAAGARGHGQSPPVVLTIAGSDNSAGAGVQADLKTITALGCHGLTAVTCVVAEIPGRVEAVQPVRPGILAAQIRLCIEAFPVAAIKVGMVYSRSLLRVICAEIRAARASGKTFFLVVDPVMVASSGNSLVRPETARMLRSELLPMADLTTPNLDELAVLCGHPIANLRQMRSSAIALRDELGVAVLAKGGHLPGRREAIDLLAARDGRVYRYSASFIRGAETHGTGCALSAAVASLLAAGAPLPDAVGGAKRFITSAIANSLRWDGIGALNLPCGSR